VSPRGQRIVVALAALATVLLTARLGVWQLDRAGEKTALQAAIERRAQLPVLQTLPPPPGDPAALLHRRAELTGRWSAAHTVHLDNRQMFGRPGFYVVTPLLLPDGQALLVQRGWQPRDPRDRTQLREVPTPSGDVRVAGRIAPPPARLFEFDAGGSGRIRQNLDLDAFARETGLRLLPLSMLQTAPADDDGLQREWPVPDSGVAKHHGYAFQWFGLSALVIVLYVWFQFIQPRRRRR
jgi:surfeit locus 1 family protein